MKQAVFTSGGISISEIPVPKPASGEVLVKTISCGVCEGEVFRYKGLRDSGSDKQMILGHEGTGTIAALGQGVEGFKAGDLVTTVLGGAFAEYFVTPAERLVRLPVGIDSTRIAGEAVACCAYAAERVNARPGERIAIIGCGFMGLMILQLLRQTQPTEILAIDPIPERLAVARRLGADKTVTPEDTGIKHDSYDVVIEATGVAEALASAIDLAAWHGRISLVGYHQSGEGLRTIDMKACNYKAIDLLSGHCRYPLYRRGPFEEAISLIAQGVIDLDGMVTVYPFSQIEDAFSDSMFNKENVLKASVVFE